MNYWLDEKLAELNRQRIIEEMALIHFEQKQRRARVYHPGRFEMTMLRFANWMIATGKQLRKRYEIPQVNCNQTPSEHFAR